MLSHGLTNCVECLVQRVECLIHRLHSRRIFEGPGEESSRASAMSWAHFYMTIQIHLAIRSVATGTFEIHFSLALEALVLLSHVPLQDIRSRILHWTEWALPRHQILMSKGQVVGELVLRLEFLLAPINHALNFVSLARRNVHVLEVGRFLFENLLTVTAHQGAVLSVCLHPCNAREFHIAKGAATWLRCG